jgi:hypothetical protein
MTDELQDYFDHAQREMFPRMKSSAFCISIIGEPDPKLCMEIGAAIMFDKPILVILPRGRNLPLSLRTIAHKVVEIESDDLKDPASRNRLSAAVSEVLEFAKFRGREAQP